MDDAELKKEYRRQGLVYLLIGLGLIVLGSLITLVTLWLAWGGGIFVVAYGPVISGFYLAGVGALRLITGGSGEKTAAKIWTYVGFALIAASVAWFDIAVLRTIWQWIVPPEEFQYESPLGAACGILSAPLVLGAGCLFYAQQFRTKAP